MFLGGTAQTSANRQLTESGKSEKNRPRLKINQLRMLAVTKTRLEEQEMTVYTQEKTEQKPGQPPKE